MSVYVKMNERVSFGKAASVGMYRWKQIEFLYKNSLVTKMKMALKNVCN